MDTNLNQEVKKFNSKKVFATVGIILIVIILVAAGVWYIVQNAEDKVPTNEDVTVTKVASSSAKTATTSATKDETTDWKTLNTKIPDDQLKVFNLTSAIKFSFRYPTDFRVVNNNGTDIATNNPTYPGLESGREGVYGALGGQDAKNAAETTIGGKKAIKIVANKETYIHIVYNVEEKSSLDSFDFVCDYAPKIAFDGEKLCDLIASTFKFL